MEKLITDPSITLQKNDKAERILIPLHANCQKNSYGDTLWHIHLDDMRMRHYYIMTTSETVAEQVLSNINKPMKARFTVAGVWQFGFSANADVNCTRIKNVTFKK